MAPEFKPPPGRSRPVSTGRGGSAGLIGAGHGASRHDAGVTACRR